MYIKTFLSLASVCVVLVAADIKAGMTSILQTNEFSANTSSHMKARNLRT